MKQQENNKQLLGEIKIKTEPGTSTSPVMQRLPSLKPPRDLSLSAYSQKIPNLNSAKMKKIYTPNLNVQRNKLNESVTVKSEPVKPNLPDKKDRTRDRQKRNFVHLNQGVFAEGIPGQRLAAAGRGRYSGGSGDAPDNMLKKPTLKLRENVKVDKKEEESMMKQLLKDDFIDDPTLEPDFNHCPIILPLSKEDPGLKKRSDIKHVDKKEHTTINEVFCDTNTTNPGYIFLQLPSCMPGLKSDSQSDGPKFNPQAASSVHANTTSTQPAENKEDSERCLLTSLPGGQIGKLQVLKSGRARLVFGNTKMWLDMGTQVAFKQDLVSTQLDQSTHTGHMVNLGPVNIRMVATPDWESIMEDLKTKT